MKKLISLTLVFLLVFSVFSSVYAAEPDKTILEKAIVDVKTKIDIPSEYSDFDYYYNGENSFSFYWHLKSDSDYGYIYVYYHEGDILTYEKYGRDSSYSDNRFAPLAKVSRFEAEAKAIAFAKNMGVPADEYRLSSCEPYNGKYMVSFELYKNDIPVSGIYYGVLIDYVTGEITYFAQQPPQSDAFAPADVKITPEQAQEILKSARTATLQYYSYYDYEAQSHKVVPCYFVDGIDYFVNAATGEVITKRYDPYKDANGRDTAAGEAGMADGAPSPEKALTPEEQLAVEEYEGLLTLDEAISALKAALPRFDGYSVDSSSLSREYTNKENIFWSISFSNPGDDSWYNYMYAKVNAKTGEIVHFYDASLYKYDEESKAYTVDMDALTEKAEAFIAEFSKGDYTFELSAQSTYESGNSREVNFYFNRMENGIPVSTEGVSLTYSNKEQAFLSYSKNVTNAVFPVFTPAGEDAALEACGEQNPISLAYVYFGESYDLVYLAQSNVNMFDGATAKPINYDGSPYDPGDYKIFGEYSYSDIDGHFAKDKIEALANIGVGFGGGKFNPNEIITEKELVLLILQAASGMYISPLTDTAALYSEAVYHGIFVKSEQTYPDSPVNRARAAEIFAKLMGFGEIMVLDDIFSQPFDDVTLGTNGYGAIAVIKGFGIVGGADGMFYPHKELTRGEAAVMLYNLLAYGI